MFASPGPHLGLEPHDSWKNNTAGHQQSRSFLKCFGGFLIQVLKDLMDRCDLLDLILKKQEKTG